MANAEITLQNSLVNGGTAITLYGGTCNYNWKNLTSKKAAQGYYDTIPVEKGGFEAPAITLSGWIIVRSDFSLTNKVTQEMLMDLSQAKTPTKVTITYGKTGNRILKGRPLAGYSIGGTYTDYMWVELENFSMNFSSRESEGGMLVTISIGATETHPPQ